MNDAPLNDSPHLPIIVYWRPGCGFCRSLTAGLHDVGVVFEAVNIWEDPEAAAFVRSVASGNEVVPTVRIGGSALVNPSPRQVLRAVDDERTTQAQPMP